uniref:EGF-like domain-containing protein n=1 Tax=Panagrellus redivivus TaxID=6233 RepID=A0A7E4VVW4_PANRE
MRPNAPLTIHCPLESDSTPFRWFFNDKPIKFKLKNSWSRVHVFNDTKSLYIDAIKRTASIACARCDSEDCNEWSNFEFVVQNVTDIRVPCDNHGNVTVLMSAGGTHVYSCVCDYGFKGSHCEIPFIGKFRLTFVFWAIVIGETFAMGFVIHRHMKQAVFRPPADGYRFVDVLNDAYGLHPPSPPPPGPNEQGATVSHDEANVHNENEDVQPPVQNPAPNPAIPPDQQNALPPDQQNAAPPIQEN